MLDGTMTEDVDALPGLLAAGRLGPYFAVETGETVQTAETNNGGWLPLDALPDAARDRVRLAATQLAARTNADPESLDGRAVASTVFLGLAARLVSPALGATVLGGAVPDLRGLRWRPTTTGPLPLAMHAARARPATDPDEAAALLVDRCLRDPIEPLLNRFRAEFSLSPKVLWGNVASAVTGAIRLLGAGESIRDRLLALPPLAGTLRQHTFVRRSCCLYYRLPGGGLCGDCVLAPGNR